MPQPTSPLPFPLSGGPFRYSEAKVAGIGRGRLRADDIDHPHHGLYAPTAADDIVTRCENLVPLLGEHAWFSHLTAARLWGMPLPFASTADEPLHVLTLAAAAPMRRRGVVGWETSHTETPRAMMGLIPLVSASEVWVQLAVPGSTGVDAETGAKRRLSREWLTAVGDYLLTGPKVDGARRPLCTVAELTESVARRRRARGVVDLTWALDMVRAAVHSPKETEVRLGLVACGLPEPDVQVPVMTSAGLRHADLGYPGARLLIEYHGDQHRTDRVQWLEDLTRRQLFEDAGYRVMEVGAADLKPNCHALAARVRRALDGGAFAAPA